MFSVAKTTFVLNENTATQGEHLIRKEWDRKQLAGRSKNFFQKQLKT